MYKQDLIFNNQQGSIYHETKPNQISCIQYIQGSLNKFPDFFRMGTFIDITHMKLKSPSN